MKWADRRLARRVCAGDRAAARELVDRHHGSVYAFLVRVGAPCAVAEDLTQDTYAKAWRKVGDLRDASSARSWLIAIARNEYRQWVRRGALEAKRLEAHAPRPNPEPDADELVVRDESERALMAAVRRLPDELRELVVLHYLQGLSLREVASVLGAAVGTIKSRLNRALARLRAEMEEHDGLESGVREASARAG
jgi:RNA polymerase sigma-70 factor (ECF subfamily)